MRSVSERRRTIGVLRALGYRKNMVMISFVIEVSWVALLGILNGVIIAVGFHRALYTTFWESQGAEFSLPWSTILMVIFGGWILVLAATTYQSRRLPKFPLQQPYVPLADFPKNLLDFPNLPVFLNKLCRLLE